MKMITQLEINPCTIIGSAIDFMVTTSPLDSVS